MTDQALWAQVDGYIGELFVGHDAALEGALERSRAAGLPAIQVAPNQGKLLYLLARAVRARRILEVGTLGGYSTIWLARALEPGGALVSLELDPHHAEVARSNLRAAGLDGQAEVRVGPALEALPTLESEGAGPFDLVFIDADRPNARRYVRWAVRLARPGSLIVVDNVVRRGGVADAASTDENVQGIRAMNDWLARSPSVEVTEIQTVGSKGHDGFALAVVREVPAERGLPPP